MSWLTLAHVAMNTAIVYVFVTLLLRSIGRRELGQNTPGDILVILMMGSAVETSMVSSSTSLKVGLVSGTTLLLMNFVISRYARNHRTFRRLFAGEAVVIVRDGHLLLPQVRRLGLSEEDVMAALRQREQGDLGNIRYAVFEANGEINVVSRDADCHCSDLNADLAALREP